MQKEPKLSVGIVTGKQIKVSLQHQYIVNEQTVEPGEYTVTNEDDNIELQGKNTKLLGEEIILNATNADARFEVADVTIGIGFHWEKKETQIFSGDIKFIQDGDDIHLVNLVPVETYLLSVISSEMKASSSIEFLKAHAIISRSWVLSQIEKNKQLQKQDEVYTSSYTQKNEKIRWYDREDHTYFDVCADDHCQRYQGVGRATTPLVKQAIEETRGEVLMFGESICDARFSKCCGGVTEQFENVWEPTYHPYLETISDKENCFDENDLEIEKNAQKWITTKPDAYCNTTDKKILSQVLNDYDLETQNFYRWKVEYSQRDVRELIKKKTKIDFGTILDLVPMERGTSGRIIRLKIVGSKATYVYGKELEIRRILSESHLYSSAFVVKKEGKGKVPQRFILQGAGWGHGVGLCQIGAAVMGAKGHQYQEILGHYFQNAECVVKYS